MEYLRCDRCGITYQDAGSISMAKGMASDWAKDCRKDGEQPRGLAPCPNISCQGELVLQGGKRPLPGTTREALERWPRLTAHLICQSLGYFTPHAAANALLHHKRGEPFCCEWYIHMARGLDAARILHVGAATIELAFRGRYHHRGYMAHYPQARALVEDVRRGGEGPIFASWF